MLEIQKFGKIFAANWKMNGSISFIDSFIKKLEFSKKDDENRCIVIFPPLTHVKYTIQNVKDFYVGAQNCSIYLNGAYTGDVSASMLKDIGCKFCIVGHSERRGLFSEKSAEVSQKVKNLINNKIIPIICIGETLEQKQSQKTKEVISKQLKESIPTFSNPNNSIIAYEPIWAIGTGLTPTIEDIIDIHSFIKKEISGNEKYKILYGGSVKSNNAKEILSAENVDGVLVGGASLDCKEFSKILSY